MNILPLLLPVLLVMFIIAAGVIVLNQHFHKNLFLQKLMREEMDNRHRQQLLRASIQAQEEERRRIAADIHDELGAVLSIAKMHLINLGQKAVGDEAKALSYVRSLVETTIGSVRRISHELMPQHLKLFGLPATLQNLAEVTNGAGSLRVGLDVSGLPVRIPWDLTLGIYRICLELLNNTVKHAAATQVMICFSHHDGYLHLLYEDDGRGLPAIPLTEGLGLKNIEARVFSLGGTIVCNPKTGEGFTADVTLPCKEVLTDPENRLSVIEKQYANGSTD